MQNAQFDPYGEPVAYTEPKASVPGSRFMLRAGTGLFWSLVVVIVAARAAYFNPDFAASFGQIASAIKSIFGA